MFNSALPSKCKLEEKMPRSKNGLKLKMRRKYCETLVDVVVNWDRDE
jgi:hypothetical protein